MSTRSPSLATTRLDSLTGLRFLAALFVFFSHVIVEGFFKSIPWHGKFDVFSAGGPVAVSFFFVLSGFVLTWSAKRDEALLPFWRRRIVKIYPNHIITWAAGMLLLAVTAQPPVAHGGIPSLLLLHTWFPRTDLMWECSPNAPSWSLCPEMFFYVMFPFLLRGILTIRTERIMRWTVGVAVAILLVPLAARALPAYPEAPFAPTSFWRFWFIDGWPVTRTLEFALGMLLARLLQEDRWPKISLGLAMALLVPGYALAIVAPVDYSFVAATIIPLAVLIPTVARLDIEKAPSLFRSRTMVWLGEVSFAFYLVHNLVLHFGKRAVGDRVSWDIPSGLLMTLVFFVVTLAASWALYVCIERPAMRLLSRAKVRGADFASKSTATP